MEAALLAALVSCAEDRAAARNFLLGLSYDELQFIAGFLGASILEAEEKRRCSRAQLAREISEYQRMRVGGAVEASQDLDHKMILLLEFLCRSGLQQAAVAVRSSHA